MYWTAAGGQIARGIDADDLLSRRGLDKFVVDEEADWLLIFSAIGSFELNEKIRHVEGESDAACWNGMEGFSKGVLRGQSWECWNYKEAGSEGNVRAQSWGWQKRDCPAEGLACRRCIQR